MDTHCTSPLFCPSGHVVLLRLRLLPRLTADVMEEGCECNPTRSASWLGRLLGFCHRGCLVSQPLANRGPRAGKRPDRTGEHLGRGIRSGCDSRDTRVLVNGCTSPNGRCLWSWRPSTARKVEEEPGRIGSGGRFYLTGQLRTGSRGEPCLMTSFFDK